jgi:hypothetical protein
MTRGAWEKLKSYAPQLVRPVELIWRLINLYALMTAFGLGIDKKDVRFVIHHSVSSPLLLYVLGHT